MVSRRHLLTLAAGALAAPSLGFGAAGAGTVAAVDVLGNVLSLPSLPKRIVILDASDLYAVAALLPDPAERIVGWASAARLDLGPETALLGAGFPEVGGISPTSISAEAVLALKPDLVVASAYMLPPQGSALQEHLHSAGIPVAWTSGHDHELAPQEKLRRAMQFWGVVLGQQARAAEITALGLSRFQALAARPVTGERPRVYMEVMTTYDTCCWAAGEAFWGDLFALVGGDMIAGSKGWSGQLSIEGLMAFNPQVYIATGGNFAPGLQPGIAPGLDPDAGREGLRKAANRQGLLHTDAVRLGRVHGVWSGLMSSPLLLPVLAEVLAMFLHPEHYSDVDPQDTMTALNRYFTSPLPGPMWLSVGDK